MIDTKYYPPLIDNVIENRKLISSVKVLIGGYWFISREKPYYALSSLLKRIFHAYLVLSGKAMAIQFAQDRPRVNISGYSRKSCSGSSEDSA